MAHRGIATVAVILTLLGSGVRTFAQSADQLPKQAPAITKAHVASTGKNMPQVGHSKSDGVTPLDKQEELKMRQETTICKGC